MKKNLFTLLFLCFSVYMFSQGTDGRYNDSNSGGGGATQTASQVPTDAPIFIDGNTYNNVQDVLNAIPDSEVLKSNTALTGSSGSYKLGVNETTGDLYYSDGTGNWTALPSSSTSFTSESLTSASGTFADNRLPTEIEICAQFTGEPGKIFNYTNPYGEVISYRKETDNTCTRLSSTTHDWLTIPSSAFANPDDPTNAEVKVWADANASFGAILQYNELKWKYTSSQTVHAIDNIRFFRAPIRWNGTVWEVAGGAHKAFNISGITTLADRVNVQFDFNGIEVVSSHVTPDETLLANGYLTSNSVGTDNVNIFFEQIPSAGRILLTHDGAGNFTATDFNGATGFKMNPTTVTTTTGANANVPGTLTITHDDVRGNVLAESLRDHFINTYTSASNTLTRVRFRLITSTGFTPVQDLSTLPSGNIALFERNNSRGILLRSDPTTVPVGANFWLSGYIIDDSVD